MNSSLDQTLDVCVSYREYNKLDAIKSNNTAALSLCTDYARYNLWF